jgi:hypothetical protein
MIDEGKLVDGNWVLDTVTSQMYPNVQVRAVDAARARLARRARRARGLEGARARRAKRSRRCCGATSPAAGGVRGVSPRQPHLEPASAAGGIFALARPRKPRRAEARLTPRPTPPFLPPRTQVTFAGEYQDATKLHDDDSIVLTFDEWQESGMKQINDYFLLAAVFFNAEKEATKVRCERERGAKSGEMQGGRCSERSGRMERAEGAGGCGSRELDAEMLLRPQHKLLLLALAHSASPTPPRRPQGRFGGSPPDNPRAATKWTCVALARSASPAAGGVRGVSPRQPPSEVARFRRRRAPTCPSAAEAGKRGVVGG